MEVAIHAVVGEEFLMDVIGTVGGGSLGCSRRDSVERNLCSLDVEAGGGGGRLNTLNRKDGR